MADGHPEIADYPLVYMLRHMPRGRKQAAISSIAETRVVRIPGWTSAQAPVVGSVTTAEGQTTLYRAARNSDGVVRMVAEVASSAFTKIAVGIGQEAPQDLSNAHLFRVGRTSEDNSAKRALVPGDPAIGAHLSSDRARALRHAEMIEAGMVMVDGMLHAVCNEPGWLISRQINRNRRVYISPRAQQMAEAAGCNTLAKQAIAASGPSRYTHFIHFCADPEPMIRALSINPSGRVIPIIEEGDIREHVAGAFSRDVDWHRVRVLAGDVYHAAHASSARMMIAELNAAEPLCRASEFWPKEPNAELARRVVAMSRIVHSINSANTAPVLQELVARVASIEGRGPGLDLEARLELAGVVLPALPGIELAHAGQPGPNI